MNARMQPRLMRRAMNTLDIDAVQAIEAAAYGFPWTRGNFIDSLVAGYLAEVLQIETTIVAYFVAMAGVDELHLLNITVAPAHQGQGLGSALLERVQDQARARGLGRLLLEVRQSNQRARALYQRRGFADVGLRRGYYPAPQGREDAVVMGLQMSVDAAGLHGLV